VALREPSPARDQDGAGLRLARDEHLACRGPEA
jgi:hypothetical protein